MCDCNYVISTVIQHAANNIHTECETLEDSYLLAKISYVANVQNNDGSDNY